MSDERPKKGPPVGRMAFNMVAADIKAALDRGEWMSTIYERYKQQLPFSYPQFTRHVRRAFRPKPDLTRAAMPLVPHPGGETSIQPPEPVPSATVPAAGEPLQAPPSDRPKRFSNQRLSEDKLF